MKTSAWLKLILFNLTLLILLLFSLELALRWKILPNQGLYIRNNLSDFLGENFEKNPYYRPDPDLGWVRKEGIQKWPDYSYKINKEGFREDEDFDSLIQDQNRKRIIVLGDSFVFGLRLKKDFTLPRILEKKLGPEYKVFNLGMPAWGIDQMYLAYKKYAPVIKPDIVILVFITDDILRVSKFQSRSAAFYKPAFEIKDNLLIEKTEDNPSLFERIAQNSYLLSCFYRKIYKYYHAKKVTELALIDLARITKQRGQELIVVRYPCLYEFESKGWTVPLERGIIDLGVFCRSNNIKFLDAYGGISALGQRERSKLYLAFEKDKRAHPSQGGNEYLSDLLVNHFFKKGRQK